MEYRIFNSRPEISQGISIATAYSEGLVKGWDESLFKIVGNSASSKVYKQLPPSLLVGTAGRKAFLYQVTRKLLGQDTRNYPQQIGDCVSFGAKNAIEYLIACEKLLHGDTGKFRPIFPPYLYGTGRVYIGRGQLGNDDGSLGRWMAEAVIKHGVLAGDELGVPAYSGAVAKAWGGPSGSSYLNKWKSTGEKHLVKSAAQINNWDELVGAIVNGYPCTVASMQGFNMEASSDGFHKPYGQWAHQMCIIGVDDEYPDKYALILNSWGDVHGRLKSFDGNEDLPVGVIRARKNVVEAMIRAGETFAYSQFEDFEPQSIDEALFKIVGR